MRCCVIVHMFFGEHSIKCCKKRSINMYKSINISSALLGIVMLSACLTVPISAAQIGYWNLDGNSSDSINGNNGTIAGNVSYVAGTINQGATFDGAGDTIDIAEDAAELDTTFTAFTAMAWIKPDSAGGLDYLMGKMGAADGERGWDIWVRAGTGDMRFTIFGEADGSPNDSLWPTGLTLNFEKWTHLTVTFAANDKIAIYLNGELVASKTTTLTQLNGANNALFQIGSRGSATPSDWQGEIDEVKLFDEALTADEIKNEMPSSIGYWPLDAINGGITPDATVYTNNDATVTGNASLVGGKIGNAITFDGTDDYLNVASNAPALDSSFAAFTAMAWITPTTEGAYDYLMGKMGDTSNRGWDIWINQSISQMRVTLYSDATGTASDALAPTGISFPTDKWTHIAFTFAANDIIAIYKNGELISSKSTLLDSINGANNVPFQIGCRGSATPGDWHGKIDEVKIFAAALTEKEIRREAQLFNGTVITIE